MSNMSPPTPFRQIGMIVRHVKVDRPRSPEQVLDATGRIQCIDKHVVKSMLRGTGEDIDVYFLKLNCWTSDDDIGKDADSMGLCVADPYSLAKVNEDDPAFADTYPNGTHWKDADGKWCFVAFYNWAGDRAVNIRYVNVRHNEGPWSPGWFVAYVSK